MAIERIEMSLLKLPFVHFFETSFSREYDRTFIIIRVFEEASAGRGNASPRTRPSTAKRRRKAPGTS